MAGYANVDNKMNSLECQFIDNLYRNKVPDV